MTDCWTCGNHSHSDSNCPYRVTRPRVHGATDVKRAAVKVAEAAPPKRAGAQAGRVTSRASPNPNVDSKNDDPNDRDNGDDPGNGHNHGSSNDGLNGSRKGPQQRLPPMGKEQQSCLNSDEGTSSQQRSVPSNNQRTKMAPTTGTAVSTASSSSYRLQNAIVNGQTNKPVSNGDGRPSGYVSSSLPPHGTVMGASSFDSSSLADEPRRRLIAGPVTRRPRYLEYREAFVGWGAGGEDDGLAGGSSLRAPQGEMARRKSLDASSSLRRWEQQRRHERRRPRRISGEVVAYQAAKHAVEDLFTAPPLQIGVALLAFAFAISASSRALLVSLWTIVLSLGATLWIRADVPPPPKRASPRDPGASRGPRRVQPWVEMELDDDGGEGRSGKEWRGREGVLSVVNTRRLVMALVLARFAVDVVSIFWFFRFAIRTESPWLALVLFQASAVYAVSKRAAVAARGQKELRSGTNFRYLVASWHTLLFLAAALEAAIAAQPLPRLDGTTLREGIGSALVGVAAWQLSKVSERRVERASRYGIVVSVGKVLGNVDGRELSKESMLELAFGRWLVDYWSQPPSFSASEMRCMLAQAASSLASGELSPRVSAVGVRDCSLDGSFRSPPAEACTLASVAALMECLDDRTSSPPSKRLETALETLNPSRWSCLSLLLVMTCPTLCALPALVLHQALWGPPASWTAAGFVLALLVGPVGVEVLRLKRMRDEMCSSKAGEEVLGTASWANDSLSFLLRRTNPGLSCVLANARRALESLQVFRREDENGEGNSNGVSDGNQAAVAKTKSPGQKQQQQTKQHVVFHDKTRTLRDVFDGIGKEGCERSASWIARESSSPPVAYYRSVENTTSPGRLSSRRTNNSLGLTRKPPPSPKLSVAVAAAAAAAAAAVAAANGGGENSRREDIRKSVSNEPELIVAAEAVAEKPPSTKTTSTSTSKDGSRRAENGDVGGTSEEILADQAPPSSLSVNESSPATSPSESRAKTPPMEVMRDAGVGDVDWVSGASHAIVGTTLAVVGAADDVVGTIRDVAGGAVGSIPVLAGVLGFFGMGEGQQ